MGKEMSLKQLLIEENSRERVCDLKFEEGMKVLEELVTNVEAGALPLDKAVQSYELGASLIDHLRKLLGGAEARLKVLQQDSQGEIKTRVS